MANQQITVGHFESMDKAKQMVELVHGVFAERYNLDVRVAGPAWGLVENCYVVVSARDSSGIDPSVIGHVRWFIHGATAAISQRCGRIG